MSDESIPQSLIVLREEFAAVADYVNFRMIALPQYSKKEYDLNELVNTHLKDCIALVSSISNLLNQELDSVLDKSDEQIRSSVRALSDKMKGLLDGYDEVRRLYPYEAEWEPWKLLIEIYYDTLCQFQHWFVDVLKKLDNPVAEARKRGLADTCLPTLKLTLNLDAPKAMNRLTLWLQRESERIGAAL